MSIIQLILILVVLGFCWYLIERFIPMPPLMWTIIRAIIVIVAVILLLNAVGVNTGINVGRSLRL